MLHKGNSLGHLCKEIEIAQQHTPRYMCRSKRPGLVRAGSRTSARLVPANTTTLVLLLNPALTESDEVCESYPEKNQVLIEM